MSTDDEIIVVHTGESKSLLWNPLTHDEFRQEMADGNQMFTVTPKPESPTDKPSELGG